MLNGKRQGEGGTLTLTRWNYTSNYCHYLKLTRFFCSEEMDENTARRIVEERLLKAVEIAEILNISKAMAYQLMKQRKIHTIHIEGARRVRPADLRLYIEQNLAPSM